MEFQDRIKTRRTSLGLTLEEIARKVGVSGATVSRWESGNIQNLRKDKITKLADALQVTPAYLMGWEEETEHLRQAELEIADIAYELDIPEEELKRILSDSDAGSLQAVAKIIRVAHQLSHRGPPPSGGQILLPVFSSVHTDEDGAAVQDPVGEEALPEQYASDGERYFWMVVKGDSMSPALEPGDRVLIRYQHSVESGALAIVAVNGEDGAIRKVVYGDGWIELQSANPYYPPRRFDGEEKARVTIIGKAVESIRNWR